VSRNSSKHEFDLKSRLLRRFAVAHFTLECQFWFPVWLIFLTQKGFDLTTIVLADGVFRLTAVVMEFPMGFISDRLGRKNTYISICILSIITYCGIIFINGDLMLFVVWIIWGILWSLYSGVPSSYIYELIIKERLESQTVKVMGIFKMISSSALLFSYLGAGFLMSYQPGMPFAANILMVILALFFILLLPGTNADNSRLPEHKNPFSVLRLFKRSINGTKIIIMVSLMALTLIFFWSPRILMQPLFIELQLSAIEVGLVYFAYSLAGIIAGLLVNRIAQRLGYKRAILAGFLIILFGIALTGFIPGYVALIFLPLLTFGFTISQTILEKLLHNLLENWHRATLLSTAGFLGGIVIIFTRPGLGILADNYDSKFAFLIWALAGLIITLVYAILLKKIPKQDIDQSTIHSK